MAKTLLTGPAGCGKTGLLLDAFKEYLRNAPDPLAPDGFFVVPSMEHTERVVSLLAQRGVSGFFHRRVTTLSKLVSDLFRVTDVPVVSSLTRTLIVKDLLRTHDWEYFREVQDQPGFPGLMGQFLTELKEAALLPGDFRARMNVLKGFEPAYAAKYEALAAFYEQYTAELQKRGLRESQDVLWILRERQKKGGKPLPRLQALWIDGFFDFSNLQREYLRELCGITDEITVTLPQEDGPGWEDAFETVAGTRQSLVALGFKVQKLKALSLRTRKPALRALQKDLFSGEKATCGADGITLLEAVGTDGEIELIAREIHRLYATGNYRYSDFAVLFRQIKNYAPVIAAIFERYGIPAEVHERERLKFSPWIGTVLSFLSIFRNGWKKEDLFGFLKSGYVRFLGEDRPKNEAWVEAFEQRAFQEGVTGSREAWTADWKGRGRGDFEAFQKEKAAALAIFAEYEDAFFGARTGDEHCRILRRAVYRTFQILEVSDAYTPFVRRDAACVRRFEALLEEMGSYFIKHKVSAVSFESFADHFLGLAELDVYSAHERDKNRVQVYDVSLARQKEYKGVFVAGLLEKVFPLRVRENPLLSDWERKLTNGETEYPLAEQLPRQSIEKLFFYFAVTRASELLYLSYPHRDIEGKEALPSFYLEEVRALFGGRVKVLRQNLARPYLSPEEAVTRRELEIAVLGALRNISKKEALADRSLRGTLEELLVHPPSYARIHASLRPVRSGLSDERIRTGRYLEISETSPTRLEEYAKCPYRYFANRVLKLKDPSQDIAVMQKGNILHYVLQQYFDPRREKTPPEPLEPFIRRELEAGFQKYPLVWSDPYREDLDRRELFEMLFYFLQEETKRLAEASFKPLRVEYSFGSAPECHAPALEIAGEGKRFRLQGRVDRIDTDKERTCAVVVDYKRSARFKRADLELGVALQLPLYLLSVRQHLKLAPLGGEIYSVRDRKRSGFYCADRTAPFGKEFSARTPDPEEEFQKILDRALRFSGKFIKAIEALEIPVKPRACESFCPYSAVCRIEKWKLPVILEEIRKADALEAIAENRTARLPEGKSGKARPHRAGGPDAQNVRGRCDPQDP